MAARSSENKKLAIAILESQGKNYDEWLNEKHNELIINSVGLLSKALKTAGNINNITATNSNNNNNSNISS